MARVRSSDRRLEILEAAEAVLAAKGYRAATVRDIGERAGILSGSLYHHFGSKEAMVGELIGEFLELVVGRLGRAVAEGSGPEERLRLLMAENSALVQQRPAMVTLLYNDWPLLRELPTFAPLRRMYAQIGEVWTEVLRDGAAQGVFAESLDAGLMYRSIQAASMSTVRWLAVGGALSAEQVLQQQTELFINGLSHKA